MYYSFSPVVSLAAQNITAKSSRLYQLYVTALIKIINLEILPRQRRFLHTVASDVIRSNALLSVSLHLS